MKFMVSMFVIIFMIVLLFASGCTSQTQKAPDVNITPSSPPSNAPDIKESKVDEAYHASSNEISNQMKIVSNAFPLETTAAGKPYSRSDLEQKGASLKWIADQWHKQMVQLKDLQTKEEEMTRIAHLQYLMGIKNSGSYIEEAANAEAKKEYSLAEDYARKAKVVLQNIKEIPDSEHQKLIETLIKDLDDYQLKMNHQI